MNVDYFAAFGYERWNEDWSFLQNSLLWRLRNEDQRKEKIESDDSIRKCEDKNIYLKRYLILLNNNFKSGTVSYCGQIGEKTVPLVNNRIRNNILS